VLVDEGHRTNPWAHPSLECDVVMKGGIASGVVYPGAVVELAKRYRFRSIGGASAGAIAAAAVAAAEYGRTSGGGFGRIAQVPGELGSTVDGDPFLLGLFPPDEAGRPLFATAIAYLRFGRLRGTLHLVRSFWIFPLIALTLVVAALVLAAIGLIPWVAAVAAIAVASWLAVTGCIVTVLRSFRQLATNQFGFCRLGPVTKATKVPPLTVWLHQVIQEAAGRGVDDPPLTFAELWGLPPLRGDETADELAARDRLLQRPSWDTSGRKIDLQVMTTNLTNGRPLRLPIGRDRYENTAEDGGGLLFDRREWEGYFPRTVVQHLVNRSPAMRPDRVAELEDLNADKRELFLFPGSGELPVVVAARMSLSFPVLISTVPLWRVQRQGRKPRLARVVFSDGGISSNFPVHFFDSPLPTRPTFALNLAGFGDGEAPVTDEQCKNVADPAPVNRAARENWIAIDSMFAFFVSIKDAMENWRDNAQARLPGFRDRIIHIKLAKNEGGLNLAMDEEKVRELTERGACAAERLRILFSGDKATPERTQWWNDHRFARLRVTLSVLEQFLRALERGYTAPSDVVSDPYAKRLSEGTHAPYALTPDLLKLAERTLADYVELVSTWRNDTLSDRNLPHPTAVLREVPRV
jgi:predicted acylesterase/phospholipase RssA